MYGWFPPELPPGPPPEPDPVQVQEPLPELEPLSASELKVLGWRLEEFERMGFRSLIAGMLASIVTIDTHRVERMLAGGCSHDAVLKILL